VVSTYTLFHYLGLIRVQLRKISETFTESGEKMLLFYVNQVNFYILKLGECLLVWNAMEQKVFGDSQQNEIHLSLASKVKDEGK